MKKSYSLFGLFLGLSGWIGQLIIIFHALFNNGKITLTFITLNELFFEIAFFTCVFLYILIIIIFEIKSIIVGDLID